MHKLSIKYINYDENMSSKERRNLEHNVAYSLLKAMLMEHFGIDNPTILKTENGKPYVGTEGVHFSIAHTCGLAACVVSDTPVGVDCEVMATKAPEEIQKFAKRFFVENEISLLDKGGFSTLDFFKIWTGKEAVIKRLGSNMSDIKNIDTTKESLIYSYEKEYIICINV